MAVIALCGIKGGVGKSVSAVNLAVLAARGGERALLWDLDAQGASTFHLASPDAKPLRPRRLVKGTTRLTDAVVSTRVAGLDLVPAGLGLRRLELHVDRRRVSKSWLRGTLDGVRESYRWIFLDCPPGLGLLAECVLKAADLLLVPVVPTPLCVRAWEELSVFAASKPRGRALVLPFFALVEKRRIHRLVMETFRVREPATLQTVIPRRAEVERASARGRPIVLSRPGCPSSDAYVGLWQEIRARSSF